MLCRFCQETLGLCPLPIPFQDRQHPCGAVNLAADGICGSAQVRPCPNKTSFDHHSCKFDRHLINPDLENGPDS